MYVFIYLFIYLSIPTILFKIPTFLPQIPTLLGKIPTLLFFTFSLLLQRITSKNGKSTHRTHHIFHVFHIGLGSTGKEKPVTIATGSMCLFVRV